MNLSAYIDLSVNTIVTFLWNVLYMLILEKKILRIYGEIYLSSFFIWKYRTVGRLKMECFQPVQKIEIYLVNHAGLKSLSPYTYRLELILFTQLTRHDINSCPNTICILT